VRLTYPSNSGHPWPSPYGPACDGSKRRCRLVRTAESEVAETEARSVLSSISVRSQVHWASTCHMDVATAGGREGSQSHASDSPVPGEHRDVRIARLNEEY
jgi:hypothetical protein